MLICMFILFNICASIREEDYCAHEYFKPECLEDEVIVMEEATFGRMATGKCIKTKLNNVQKNDPKYFGCKADVTDVLDDKCSGIQTCKVHVTDHEFIRRSRCNEELVQYLNVRYTCLSVYLSETSCAISLAENIIHLSIDVKKNRHPAKCGSSDNPWIIETSVGQNINVSLVTFGNTNSDELSADYNSNFSKYNKKNNSRIIGKIIETNNRVFDICLSNNRHDHLMTSKTNRIEIEITGNQNLKFLLKVEATGCYDLKPPQDAWMKREGNEITVGCYMNRHTWKLVCNGRNWIGVIGNCSQKSQKYEKENLFQPYVNTMSSETDPNQIFMIVVIISALFVIGILVICICIFFYQRIKFNNKDPYGIKQSKLSSHYNKDVMTNGVNQFSLQQNKLILDENIKPDPCYYVLED